jgi:hypothetical protein
MHSTFRNSRARIAEASGRSKLRRGQHGAFVGGSAENAPCVPPRRSGRTESSEQYSRIVVILDAKTRVIECRDGVQWIIQQKTGGGRDPWRGMSFCRTKEALVRLAGPHPVLLALPDWFPKGTP